MRRTLRWIGQIVTWAVIFAGLAAIAVAVVIPRLGGATPYTILTGSMRPDLPPGTLVVVRPANPATIRVGDVITFQIKSGDPTVATHRVVTQGVNTKTGGFIFQTKGDANNAPDQKWVRPVQIKGKLWYAIPWLGRVGLLFTGRQHEWLMYGVAAALFGYATFMLVPRRRADKRDPPESDPADGQPA
jgi:signal peptidase I